jgi:hypothetical protein
MLMKVAVTRYTERKVIDSCNAKTGLVCGSSDVDKSSATFELNRVTQYQQCLQSDCTIHVTISVHLHYPHHIIHNFASIPVIFHCHLIPFRPARRPPHRRIESVTVSLSPGSEKIGA